MSKTAQITFVADAVLKDSTLRKVRAEGITLKALLTMAMRSYVANNLTVGVSATNVSHDPLFADRDVVTAANKLGNVLKAKGI